MNDTVRTATLYELIVMLRAANARYLAHIKAHTPSRFVMTAATFESIAPTCCARAEREASEARAAIDDRLRHLILAPNIPSPDDAHLAAAERRELDPRPADKFPSFSRARGDQR